MLGRDPTKRVICASYSGDLAAKLARDSRMLMTDRGYGALFPGTRLTGKNTETEMETAHGGFRFATSVGGTLLGRGGNLIVIDDPMKPDEAASQTSRERAGDRFTGTVPAAPPADPARHAATPAIVGCSPPAARRSHDEPVFHSI